MRRSSIASPLSEVQQRHFLVVQTRPRRTPKKIGENISSLQAKMVLITKSVGSLAAAHLPNLLKVAGPVFFLGLQSSSLHTALKIKDNKSVGKLSPLPFVSLFTNCIIWTLYGLLKNDPIVLVPNGIGVITGGICTLVYNFYNKEKTPVKVYTTSLVISLVAFYLALQKEWQILGSIGCVLAVAVSGSPLATIKTVIKEKSTAALPLSISLMTWLNCISWSAYGLLMANDVMIYGPNLLGLVLSSFQMLMFILYGLPNKSPNNNSKYL